MTKAYIDKVLQDLATKNAHEVEFLQAATEVLHSIEPLLTEHPEYEQHGLLERLLEPDRIITFKVTWQDDSGQVHVNRGFRVQFNQAIGPYKGGIRFTPSVNLSVMKFLGFEQTFKNALTSLPMGGAKGGSDFDPKGKSDSEIMRFCQSFMLELYRHIGAEIDVPAGDIGVGAREIGYMFGMYRKIRNEHVGVLTGKGLSYGGSLGRTEATGYGVLYFTKRLLEDYQDTLEDKTVTISGAGNVAIFAAEKARELGAKVLSLSDSKGTIYDEQGIDIELCKEIKFEKREGIHLYLENHPNARYLEGQKPWMIPADIAIPCATQNEVNIGDAKAIVSGGYRYYIEAANMPSTDEAVSFLRENGVIIAPSKAANAGGVAVSGLEMSQNAMHIRSSFEEVDTKLQGIMLNIYETIASAAEQYTGNKENLIEGANIAGLKLVADAMLAQGYVF